MKSFMNSIHFNNGKTLFLSFMAASLLPFTASANNAAAESDGVLMNPMFWVLTGIIVVLAIFIIVLGEVVKNAAAFAKGDKTDNSKAGVILGSLAMLMLLSSDSAMAQTVADAPVNYGGLTSVLFWSMISVIAFEIIMIIFLVVIIRNLLGVEERKAALIAAKEAALAKANKAEPSLFDQFNASVSLDKEEEIMFDHEYDGIRELDNNLPPWWKYGFYVTIIWSVIYVVHYHVTRTGDLSDAEYRNEVVAAEVRIAEYMKTAANLVDETNVKVNTDGETLAKGREVYNANCSACHGKAGEGTVGPNLTDEYWLHGGSIVDIFKVVKYGIPDKGMKSWKEDLNPGQISAVSSYIVSLQGTNPPNPKEKQGDLYRPESSTAPADTSATTAAGNAVQTFN